MVIQSISPGAEILPLPWDAGFVTICKKKVEKGSMCGLKTTIRDKSISSSDDVPSSLSSSPFDLTSSSWELRTGAAHAIVPP